MKYLLLGSSITTLFTGLASATVTIQKTNPTPYRTTGLNSFVTSGGQMGGMVVTVTFSDSSTATETWVETDAISGGAVVPDRFSLTQGGLSNAGSTFYNDWTLTNNDPTASITGFSINSRPGDTVFDTKLPDKGTPGSDRGLNFAITNATDGPHNAWVFYSDSLRLTGAEEAVGDTFLQLDVLLQKPSPGSSTPLSAGESLSFMQDTDSALIEGDIIQVPEPSTGLGIGLLLSAAFFLRRRK